MGGNIYKLMGFYLSMVLESLANPFKVKKKPWEMFALGAFYSVIAFFLSYWVFREVSGMLMVFLIVMATLPTLYVTIKNEEELDLQYGGQWRIMKEHSQVIFFLLFLFLGILSSLSFLYVVMPNEMVSSVFSFQLSAIEDVNEKVVGGAVTGMATGLGLFKNIFFNNLRVLFFCIVFAFIYGAGAIFILTWNATVIAAAVGSLMKTELAKVASLVGLSSVSSYFGIATFGFMRYMIHGIFEVAAYFVAGLAGSIISVAVIKHNLKEDRVIWDATELIALSLALLILGTFVEVYVTPALF